MPRIDQYFRTISHDLRDIDFDKIDAACEEYDRIRDFYEEDDDELDEYRNEFYFLNR